MALAARKIKFEIEKGSKRPKSLNFANSIFAIYVPETIKIEPQTFKIVYLKYSIHHPADILSTFLIAPELRAAGLKIMHYSNVNSEIRIRLELLNESTHKTFKLKRRTKIAIFMMINEGTECFKKESEKIEPVN